MNGRYIELNFNGDRIRSDGGINATMKTIQNKIIKAAAWVKGIKTKIKTELPQFCPTKEE